MTNVADLRFAFKNGVLVLLEAMRDEEPPAHEDMQDWLEEKFQEFYKTYSQLQMMMGFAVDQIVDGLPKEKS